LGAWLRTATEPRRAGWVDHGRFLVRCGIPAEYEHLNDNVETDPRVYAIPDTHGHAKGEHKAFSDERPIPLSARMLFLWFYHACRRGWPRFLMVTDHVNYLTFEDPAAINLVRRALKLAQAGDLYGAAETASVEVGHAAVVSEGLRRGMRYSIGAEVDNDPRSRPDAQNIVDAMKPDGMIRSVHFLTIDHPTHGPNWNWPFDNPEFADVYDVVGTAKTWELYMATLLDAIERLPGNIVGHFYVPALFGHWPDDATLEGYEDALVDACEARGMAVEFNTRFLYRDHTDEQKANYLRAHRRLLAKCKAKNIGIAVGSDAHSPKDQGGAFATVLQLLDECAINELVFPLAGRLARVALRIERKPEAAAPEPAPTAPQERKAPRKARLAETPVAEVAVAVAADEIAQEPPKAKPRPKRSRAKAPTPLETVSGPDPSDDTVMEAVVDPEPAPAQPAASETIAIVMVTESIVTEAIEEMVNEPAIEPIVVAAEPESFVAEGDDAADPSDADDTSESFAQESQAFVASVHAFVDADSAPVDADSAPVDAEPAPVDAEPAPVYAEPAPVYTDLVLLDAEPVLVDAEPVLVEAEPVLVEAEPVLVEAEPVLVEAEPVLVEAEPVLVEAEPENEDAVTMRHAAAAADDEVPDASAALRKARPASTAARSPKTKADAAKPKPATPKKTLTKAGAKPAAIAKAVLAKKAPSKKTPAKKAAVQKVSAKKSAPKKAPAKKMPVKKADVRAPGPKKAAVKKAAAKKANPKKPAQRRR
jgi:HisJ family histidinol phosphate phosphatase